ncbi:MAG: DUF2322 family protein [Gallionellaceae bacterium]|nr:DUF2322 family protein [Gallionellaceae bacterium]
MSFAENLAALPTVNNLSRLELVNGDAVMAVIENRPGSAGSVRVYAWLAHRFGRIDREAAEEGLRLYAEHSEDARQYPGKHPNIDRLFAIAAGGAPLRVIPIPAGQ